MMSSLARQAWFPVLVGAFVALLATTGVLGARGLGLLEALELEAYDACLRLRNAGSMPDARIAVITLTERDIDAGWPLSDAAVARVIEAVARYEPRAIGLDLYRDLPIAPGTQQLERVLAAQPNVVAIMKFAHRGAGGVRPPAVLQGTERVGFSDILVDPGGIVRRGLLFLDDEAGFSYSFPLRLALRYLEAEGVVSQQDAHTPEHLRLGSVTIRPLESNDGGYRGEDARGYQFLLDFKGSGRSFPSIHLADLFAGSFDPALLRHKIVLIGVDAESVKDDFYTPFSRMFDDKQSMPGVVIHAHVASQLLRMALEGERPMSVLANWQEALWILLLGAAGVVAGYKVRPPWSFALWVFGGGLAGVAMFGFLAFVAGWWLPMVPPALTWILAAGLMTAYMFHRESIQRAQLMQLFSRHVSREVADSIWLHRHEFMDGGRPRSERLTVTALFTDLTGFTVVAEKHTPEALLEWLNEYMDAMSHEVGRHGGVIRQYAGDAIVAFFGIPIPRKTDAEIEQDARNAVACALAMETALGELNRRWRRESRPITGMRMGIFTGSVIGGTLGSAQRSEYVVAGDTVNTASRLESFDKEVFAPHPETRPVRILIGEPTLQRLGSQFVTEYVDDVSLKGKAQKISVYRVLGAAPERQPALRDSEEGACAATRGRGIGRIWPRILSFRRRRRMHSVQREAQETSTKTPMS